MHPVEGPPPAVQTEIEITLALLDDLTARNHPAAAPLREAWLIDLVLREQFSLAQAAQLGGVPAAMVQSWLRRRRIASLAAPADDPPPELSVVVPVYNEEENIPVLYERLTKVLAALGPSEILFVNDGSRDRSSEMIRRLRANDGRVGLIELSRNFGHQAAITAGIDYSRGKAVVLMDADLQDPPELLAEMTARWREGYKVVYAVRQKRKEHLLKRAAYYLYYRVLRQLADIDIPADSGDFCLMDRSVADHLKRLPERNRFVRGLRSWLGFRQAAVPYERQARLKGAPKYTVGKLSRLAMDGVISFSTVPLRIAGWLGFLTCGFGVAYLVYALIERFGRGNPPHGWTSLVVVTLILGGAQLLLLGVLGAYVARIYDETKNRPTYIVDEVVR